VTTTDKPLSDTPVATLATIADVDVHKLAMTAVPRNLLAGEYPETPKFAPKIVAEFWPDTGPFREATALALGTS
jgi:hypothetical protein